MTAEIDYKARVRTGATLLDEKRPYWHNEIDLDALELSDCTWCVLGQLFGDYLNGEDALGDGEEFDAAGNGFTLTVQEAYELRQKYGDDREVVYAWLSAAWREEIATRRQASA